MKPCAYCKEFAVRQSGHQSLCAMHCRIRDMRAKAKTNGKGIPSKEKIASMVAEIVKNDMACLVCNRKMNWLAKDGRSTVVTLQHDRSGAFRLICLRCNVQHYYVKGDLFYQLPRGSRWCSSCDTVLPLSQFNSCSRRLNGVRVYCQRCCYLKKKDWLKKNRGRASEYERLRRQRHRDARKAEKCG